MSRISNKFKIFTSIFALIVVVVLSIFVNYYFKQDIAISSRLFTSIYNIQYNISSLEKEVLKSSYYTHLDNDKINKISAKVLQSYSNFFSYQDIRQDKYKNLLKLISKNKRSFDRKISLIENFKTLNAVIKNTVVFLPKIIVKVEKNIDINKYKDKIYLQEAMNIASKIFHLKNSLNFELLDSLNAKLNDFRGLDVPIGLSFEHKILVRYFELFITNFRNYIDTMKMIQNDDNIVITSKIITELNKINNDNSIFVATVTIVIVILFFLIVFYLIFIIYESEKNSKKLKKLNKDFNNMLLSDSLTGLSNRKAFKMDISNYKNPMLFIVNVNRFRHINDFYGIKAGDYILKEVALRLPHFIPSVYKYNLYRLGGDDFGILFEKDSVKNFELFAMSIIESFDNECFIYNMVELDVSVSIGMSFLEPFIEKADMALSHAKNSRLGYFLYNSELNLDLHIKENLDTMRLVKQAIESDTLVPFFQPIINNKTQEIEKYECLARIIQEDETVLSPSFFINIAQNSKLYQSITLTMIDKCIEAFKDTSLEFSINLSAADMMDDKIISSIVDKLEQNKEVANRLVFEILEDENIENYESINSFIKEVKGYGCKIAIDDFGAGFSNFAHVLNLNIDYIKFDGSLIKNLDKNKDSYLVAQTLVDFAKKANIKTIAEFVCSETIQELVSELDIDYSQGYYFSPPHKDFYHYEL